MADPELVGFFFLIRLARVYTRIFHGRVELSTRAMRAVGLSRHIRDGAVFYGYRGSLYPETVALGHGMSHIKDFALTYCRGTGLDIGANRWPLPGAHAVDNRPGENAYCLDRWAEASLDFVFSSHCLEHLHDWRNALLLWISRLKPGGILFLYLPHASMTLWQPGSPWVGDDHVWSPTVDAIVPVLQQAGMEIVTFDSGPDDYFSFHIVARKTGL